MVNINNTGLKYTPHVNRYIIEKTELYKVHRLVHTALLLTLSLLCLQQSWAQPAAPSGANSILLSAVITAEGDTLPAFLLDEVEKIDKMPRHIAKQRAQYNRLRYNVYKVYPYAIIAADILKDVDVNLAKMHDKKQRKAYLKTIEDQLKKRFKGELENLTITQGQILVKLINRQTGKNCFGIIQELKGGFSAVVWQSVAVLFSNNLKRQYDPYDKDKDIELIVLELEARNYYKYQLQQQKQQLQLQTRR